MSIINGKFDVGYDALDHEAIRFKAELCALSRVVDAICPEDTDKECGPRGRLLSRIRVLGNLLDAARDKLLAV